MENITTRQLLVYSVLFALALAVAIFVFWPALSGPFLLDDEANLQLMGADGGITSFEQLLNFIFSIESEFGRVLSMLSFVINDQHWPGYAWSFKYTNLLIHVLNGILIFVLARQIGRRIISDSGQVYLIALATMALWLLHPIQLSTMMTVVQRMTQLMMLFSLLGLICFMQGREIVTQHKIRGYVWMSLGIGLGGMLSVLSKENGILLPLYALVLEGTIIRASGLPKPQYWRLWSSVFLGLPVLVLVITTVLDAHTHSVDIYKVRDFTLVERLLTEARILVDYLHLILVPHVGGTGLFHDDYLISRGLLDPPSTLFAVIFWVVLGVGAFVLRARLPIVAFAVLWFLAGHSLESSIIPLEIYFEHRNYLPMVGIVFAEAYYLLVATRKLKPITASILILIIGGYGFLSYQSSFIWGNAPLLANVWAEENPTSIRAQQYAAGFWVHMGDYEKALDHYYTVLEYHPDSVGVMCQVVAVKCHMNQLDRSDLDKLIQLARTGQYITTTLDCINRLPTSYEEETTCPAVTGDTVDELLGALLENPHYAGYSGTRRQIYYAKGLIGIHRHDLNFTMKNLDKAFQAKPSVEIAMMQAKFLASAGLYDDALKYLRIAQNTAFKKSIKDRVKEWLLPREDNMDKLEQAIIQAKAAQAEIIKSAKKE